jgi:hypothetical protein
MHQQDRNDTFCTAQARSGGERRAASMKGKAAKDISIALLALRLFNEKADKLETSSFAKKILTERIGVKFSAQQGEMAAKRFGPDQESIDAFILTFRFFVQDNEPSSLHNLAGFYRDAGSSLRAETIKRFNKARESINDYLGESSFMNFENHMLTYQEIFEVFIWGGLAHAYAQKGLKERFDRWKGVSDVFQVLESEFVRMLANILKAIFYIRELNKEAIRQLEAALRE